MVVVFCFEVMELDALVSYNLPNDFRNGVRFLEAVPSLLRAVAYSGNQFLSLSKNESHYIVELRIPYKIMHHICQ